MITSLKSFVKSRIEAVLERYIEDLEATPDALLTTSPGGSARSPFDFTYEVVYVNRRVAKRMRGEDPGPANMDSWLTAPPEFQSKPEAIRLLRETTQAVVEAWEATPENELERVIPLPKGETSPLDLATLAFSHLGYHDAQINYLQAMQGDEEVHWKGDE